MAHGFHEVQFPMSIALGTSGGPARRTDIVQLSNGHESRNARWKYGRRYYDAGSGMRSVDDLYTLNTFFEARKGQLYGFRFKDPLDYASTKPNTGISALDQNIGIGDGTITQFQLKKNYQDVGGVSERLIEKPVNGSIRLAIDGVELTTSDFTADATTGLIDIAAHLTPANGALISAGFEFDVPVRFDIDRLNINLSSFEAGHVPSIPLVEIKP